MAVPAVNLTIEKGTSFEATFNVSNADGSVFSLSNYAATQSLQANTIATEFIALMSDAKNGHANIKKIQEVILEIVENIAFNAEELTEIQTAFTQSGMFAVYTLE